MSNANIDEAQSKLPKIQLIPKAIERSGWTLTTMSQWFRKHFNRYHSSCSFRNSFLVLRSSQRISVTRIKTPEIKKHESHKQLLAELLTDLCIIGQTKSLSIKHFV